MRTFKLASLIGLTGFFGFSSFSALASPDTNDLYSVNGQRFTSKSTAIRYLISLGKPAEVIHSRCEILTNKLTFKACPKHREAQRE
jgi:hypothetical protein